MVPNKACWISMTRLHIITRCKRKAQVRSNERCQMCSSFSSFLFLSGFCVFLLYFVCLSAWTASQIHGSVYQHLQPSKRMKKKTKTRRAIRVRQNHAITITRTSQKQCNANTIEPHLARNATTECKRQATLKQQHPPPPYPFPTPDSTP